MKARHLLIIASQCRDMRPLSNLRRAADELQRVLLDPDIGACTPALPDLLDEPAMLIDDQEGQGLEVRQIETTLKAALAHAADDGAELLLVLLGHGFTDGGVAELYFMGRDSVEGDASTALNINDTLKPAVYGVRSSGLIAVFDTCSASAGMPNLQAMQSGSNRGKTRFAGLLASGAYQSAADFAFAFALASVLREGISGRGEHLRAYDIQPLVQRLVSGQSITAIDYVAGMAPPAGLWLARNAKAESATGTVGPIGRQELRAALAHLDMAAMADQDLSLESLSLLDSTLARLAVTRASERARWVVDVLQLTAKTVLLIRAALADKLRAIHFDRALKTLDGVNDLEPILSEPYNAERDVDHIEHVAFSRCGPRHPPRRVLAQYLVFLFDEAREPLEPLNSPEFARWKRAIEQPSYLNDALAERDLMKETHKLWLVVSLHESPTGDRWPSELEAWLRKDGLPAGHFVFTCESPDQPGTERALLQAIKWARTHPKSGRSFLKRVDVVTPTGLLLQWKPEEMIESRVRLGVQRDVTMRWAGRLTQPDDDFDDLPYFHEQLRLLEASRSGVDLSWFGEEETRALDKLKDRFVNGGFPQAAGLISTPPDTAAGRDLLSLLLNYLPVVLWPYSDASFAEHKQQSVRASWHRLPKAMHRALRTKWHDERQCEPIAELRAVWDDHEWLDFCDDFRRVAQLRSRP